MKLYILAQCKRFQLVDNMLFGRVRLAVFGGAAEVFFGQRYGSPAIENIGPYAYDCVWQ